MNDLPLLLLIALICFLLGLVANSLAAGHQAQRRENPTAVRPRLGKAVAEPATGPTAGDSAELARLWRDRASGGLHLEMDGEHFRKVTNLNAAQVERLQRTVEELRIWMGLGDTGAITAGIAMDATAPNLQPEASLEALPQSAPIKRSSLNPINVLARAIQAEVPKSKAPVKTIASQIDEILQEKLEESPLKDRAIRLMEFPGKGMVFLVGLDQYDNLDAVPDAEIRDLIRLCVAEWESRAD